MKKKKSSHLGGPTCHTPTLSWAPDVWWYIPGPVFTSIRFSSLPWPGSKRGAAMEKRRRLVVAGDGEGDGGEASGSAARGLVESLPEALLVEVVVRLELEAACSAASSCRALRAAAAAAFSAVTSLDLSVRGFISQSLPPSSPLASPSPPRPKSISPPKRAWCWCWQMFPPTNAILNRILAGNGALRCLAVNCSLLDDSAVGAIAKGSLRELSLLKCSSFSSYLFVAVGERCKNLRCGFFLQRWLCFCVHDCPRNCILSGESN